MSAGRCNKELAGLVGVDLSADGLAFHIDVVAAFFRVFGLYVAGRFVGPGCKDAWLAFDFFFVDRKLRR